MPAVAGRFLAFSLNISGSGYYSQIAQILLPVFVQSGEHEFAP